MTKLFLALCLGVLATLVLGCDKEPTPLEEVEQALSVHRSDLQAFVERAAEIGVLAAEAPLLQQDGVNFEGRAAPRFPQREFITDYTGYNAIFVNLEDLQAPGAGGDLGYRVGHGQVAFSYLTSLLERGPMGFWLGSFADDLGDYFEKIVGLSYLVVVRMQEYTAPQTLTSGSFVEGAARGEVLVYALEDQSLLGGYRFSATSSAEVNYMVEVDSNEAHQQSVAENTVNVNFRVRIISILTEGALTHLGATARLHYALVDPAQ